MAINEKKIFYWIISILIITTVIDLYTALNSPIFKEAELNPLFLISGNTVFLTFITIIITIWVIYKLKTTISIIGIFIFVLGSLYLSLGHIVGGLTNIHSTTEYKTNPEKYLGEINKISKPDKIIKYLEIVGLFMILPLFISISAFILTREIYAQREEKRLLYLNQIYKLSHKLLTK